MKYLYKHTASGAAELLDYPAMESPDIELMAVYGDGETPPEVRRMRFEGDGLVPDEPSYAARRRAAYPSIGDQLDALWREIGGNVKSPEAKAIVEAIAKVKGDIPNKPDTPAPVKRKPTGRRGAQKVSLEPPRFPQLPDIGGPFVPEPEANGWPSPRPLPNPRRNITDNPGADDDKKDTAP